MSSKALFESKNITAMSLPNENIESDMSMKRRMQFIIKVNGALKSANANFGQAANDMYKAIKGSICSGEWLFVVAANGYLNDKHFCYHAVRHTKSLFKAVYEDPGSYQLTHQVLSFSPIRVE